jgi:SagB-type dehydrogenase family enzyme
VAARRCGGLEPALYHYDTHRHELVQLAGSSKIALKIVDEASRAMMLGPDDRRPALTLVTASRLPRLAWKYQRMVYRASLMNTGVVLNLMYLVTTDMGLAPCANGSGDSRLLQEATRIDFFEETGSASSVSACPRLECTKDVLRTNGAISRASAAYRCSVGH